MKYDKNVIDILKMYGESKGLTVKVEDEVHRGFNGTKIHTMLTYLSNGVIIQKILLTWPDDMDTVEVIKNVMKAIDKALDKRKITDYDIPSLYPRIIMNSVYGATGGYVHSNMDTIDFEKYRLSDVKMTKLLYDRANYSKHLPSIDKVIFNAPATIVFWKDGTKTIVKAQDGDTFDAEKGLAMAITKKALGNRGKYCNELKKWLPEEDFITEERARETSFA